MIDPIREAVSRARRRVVTQIALGEAFFGFAVALAGPALAILLGTDVFPAWLAALFAVAGAGWAFLRFRRALPSDYRVAQILDARLHSEDQLSTALHFGDEAGEQRLLAARAAEQGDIAAVLPYEAPRTLYWAAGAAGVCLALLALRLGTGAGLDLRSPAAPGLSAAVEEKAPAEIAEEAPEARSDAKRQPAETGDARTSTEGLERAEAQPPVPPTPDEPFEMPEVEGLSTGDDFGDEVAPTAEGETASGEPGQQGDEAGSDAQAPEKEDNEWSDSSNNLLEKLQEAFENLMEQMGLDDAQQQQAGQAGEQEQQSTGQENEEPGQATDQQAEAQGSGEPSEAEMEGGETASGEPQQTAQGSGDQNTEEPGGEGSSSSSSGTGEGTKEIEVAAQQELAMDQLEEFYMERSEEMVGEIMVETSTAEQTAFTPFQSTNTQHADSGGAAARDEVPLAYRRFIENYFRNLRQNDPN